MTKSINIRNKEMQDVVKTIAISELICAEVYSIESGILNFKHLLEEAQKRTVFEMLAYYMDFLRSNNRTDQVLIDLNKCCCKVIDPKEKITTLATLMEGLIYDFKPGFPTSVDCAAWSAMFLFCTSCKKKIEAKDCLLAVPYLKQLDKTERFSGIWKILGKEVSVKSEAGNPEMLLFSLPDHGTSFRSAVKSIKAEIILSQALFSDDLLIKPANDGKDFKPGYLKDNLTAGNLSTANIEMFLWKEENDNVLIFRESHGNGYIVTFYATKEISKNSVVHIPANAHPELLNALESKSKVANLTMAITSE